MDADRAALAASLRKPGFADWLKGQFSLDPQPDQDLLSAETAGDIALGFVPLVGQTMALRDMERARRAQDPVSGALAATGLLPFGKFAGALRNKQQIIAGANAKYAPRADMAEGRWALNKGEDPEKVWWDRGVFQGTEKSEPMKWEIPDQLARIKSTESEFSGKLSDYLEHPEFFKNYPEAKDWYVLAEKGPKVDPQGLFHATADSGFPAINVFGKTDREMIDTLLHEVQHGVQNLEKFDPGTNSEEIRKALIKQLRAREGGTLSTDFYRALKGKADTLYERNAGEVEARNVELRRLNSPQFNRSTAPFITQPLPPSLTLLEEELPHMLNK